MAARTVIVKEEGYFHLKSFSFGQIALLPENTPPHTDLES